MSGALGQYQHLAALAIGFDDLSSNGVGSGLVNGKVPEYILNPSVLRQVNPRVQCARRDRQIMRRIRRLGGGVSSWPALHEDNRLLSITANRSSGQTEHVFGFGLLQNRIERRRADVMAFIHDHMSVVFDQGINFTLARQRLHYRDVDIPCGLGLAATDGANHAFANAQE